MRIDSHQHFWRYEPSAYAWIGDAMGALRRDFLPQDLRPLLDAAQIDGCNAVQAQECDVVGIPPLEAARNASRWPQP
jgi:L-fuconolactonase